MENRHNLNGQSNHADGDRAATQDAATHATPSRADGERPLSAETIRDDSFAARRELEGFATEGEGAEAEHPPSADAEGGSAEPPGAERAAPIRPRAFALCVDGFDEADYPAGGPFDPEVLYAAGLVAGGDTITFRRLPTGQHEFSVCQSPESARALFSRMIPLRLVWM